jgi:hypothetical protein
LGNKNVTIRYLHEKLVKVRGVLVSHLLRNVQLEIEGSVSVLNKIPQQLHVRDNHADIVLLKGCFDTYSLTETEGLGFFN